MANTHESPVWPQFLTSEYGLHHVRRHDGFGSGGIIGAVFGVCFIACVGFVLYKICCASKENKVEEVMVQEGKEVEVVVQPGVTIESQTVSHSTTTTAHQAYGPPPGVMMMPPPPMPPGGGMMQPHY